MCRLSRNKKRISSTLADITGFMMSCSTTSWYIEPPSTILQGQMTCNFSNLSMSSQSSLVWMLPSLNLCWTCCLLYTITRIPAVPRKLLLIYLLMWRHPTPGFFLAMKNTIEVIEMSVSYESRRYQNSDFYSGTLWTHGLSCLFCEPNGWAPSFGLAIGSFAGFFKLVNLSLNTENQLVW